jgi:hypothetical protein
VSFSVLLFTEPLDTPARFIFDSRRLPGAGFVPGKLVPQIDIVVTELAFEHNFLMKQFSNPRWIADESYARIAGEIQIGGLTEAIPFSLEETPSACGENTTCNNAVAPFELTIGSGYTPHIYGNVTEPFQGPDGELLLALTDFELNPAHETAVFQLQAVPEPEATTAAVVCLLTVLILRACRPRRGARLPCNLAGTPHASCRKSPSLNPGPGRRHRLFLTLPSSTSRALHRFFTSCSQPVQDGERRSRSSGRTSTSRPARRLSVGPTHEASSRRQRAGGHARSPSPRLSPSTSSMSSRSVDARR